ncbi:TetR/AcrR family transcriptional regulator [Eubacterium sp. 1001713B170207_170306_E7]|uniref:TetR/AcrR family transcriptional regulator n=1 Tax=Eubacterium sp. 1001713B170207_170306_E7 TaxID=2787097 RepID=UPI0018986683|nr:TetR/AcrR family transcriptional regulator [Eubacterium sp. 1001713B170207_170306_E7]
MDKRKIANQKVKDNLLEALIDLAQHEKWSCITVTSLIKKSGVARSSFYRNFSSIEDIVDYGIAQINERYNQENPSPDENFRDKNLMYFKFRFFKEHANIVLTFHHAQTPQNLLTIINDFVVDIYGDMPVSSISKYELYYYSGAFYNMVIHWLESGAKESPEDMAEEFLRIANARF